MEAMYMASWIAAKEAIYLKNPMTEVGYYKRNKPKYL